MNYRLHYERLIARARSRSLVGYRERHHVLPRCMGGGNELENIVELTGEEHYVAHQLLVKMHPGNGGLAYAAMAMAMQSTGNKSYGWLRRRHAIAAGDRMRGKKKSPEHIANSAAARKGFKHSPEARAKMSLARRGKPLSAAHKASLSANHRRQKSMLGKIHSPETRAKMSAAQKGKQKPAEQREKSIEVLRAYAEAHRGEKRDREAVEKTAAANRGQKRTPETCANISAALRGKPLSAEHRLKISLSLMGNTHKRGTKSSVETRAKISAGLLGNINTRGKTFSSLGAQ